MSTAPSTAARPADPLGIVGDLGALLVVGLAAVVVVALASDVVGWGPLASRWMSVLVVAVVAVLVTGSAVLMKNASTHDECSPRAPTWRLRCVVAAHTILLCVYAAGAFFLSRASRVEWFLNGDHVRHLVLVADIQANGALSYDIRPYPRAWHTSVALLSSVFGTGASDLAGVIDLMSTAAWLLSAVLALATASFVASLAIRVGVRALPAAVAGAVAGATTLWPSFFGNYQALGLESSLVAAIVLAASLRELVLRPGSAAAVIVCGAGAIVMGHTWQLLMPVVGLALLATSYAYISSGARGRFVMVTAVLAISAAAIEPSFMAVAQRVGVGHAVVADVVTPVPMTTVIVGSLASIALAWRWRTDPWMVVVLALTILPAVTGVILALRLGIPVTQYYPGKLLWHTAVLGLAAVMTGAALLWVRLGQRPSRLSVVLRSAVGAAAGLVAMAACVTPSAAFRGSWSTVDGATVLQLATAKGAERAQVVWSDGPLVTDTVTRIILDAIKPELSRTDTPQGPLTVEQECVLLRAAPHPAILSNQREDAVLARYACVSDPLVIQP